MQWFKIWCCCNDNPVSLSILLALRLLHLKAENKNKSNPNLLYSSGVQLRCLLMCKNKSFGGQQWKKKKKKFKQEPDWISFENGCCKSGLCHFNKSVTVTKGSDPRSTLWSYKETFSFFFFKSSIMTPLVETQAELDLWGVHHPLHWNRQHEMITVS